MRWMNIAHHCCMNNFINIRLTNDITHSKNEIKAHTITMQFTAIKEEIFLKLYATLGLICDIKRNNVDYFVKPLY